jgi:hypothetical protein
LLAAVDFVIYTVIWGSPVLAGAAEAASLRRAPISQ